MKATTLSLVAAALVAAAANQTDAQVYFKAPVDVNGTGCPVSSLTVTGDNSPTLTIMFGQYDAARPNSKAKSGLERSACNFAVPVHVPQGYQVSVMTADWMGFSEGSTELFRRYFFAGTPLPGKIARPSGNYVERDTMEHQTITHSPCGRDVQLRINSSVQAKSPNSYIAVDTLDLNNKLILNLKWQECK